jgi:hypothetical protein
MATPELRSHLAAKLGSLEAGGSVAHESPSDEDSHPPFPSSSSIPQASSSLHQKQKCPIILESDSDDEVVQPSAQSKGTNLIMHLVLH